jgi:hypothetical protein
MRDLTNVQFNHKFLATLSLTIHIQNISTIPVDSDWYSRPYIFFILIKKYSKPYIFVNRL